MADQVWNWTTGQNFSSKPTQFKNTSNLTMKQLESFYTNTIHLGLYVNQTLCPNWFLGSWLVDISKPVFWLVVCVLYPSKTEVLGPVGPWVKLNLAALHHSPLLSVVAKRLSLLSIDSFLVLSQITLENMEHIRSLLFLAILCIRRKLYIRDFFFFYLQGVCTSTKRSFQKNQ